MELFASGIKTLKNTSTHLASKAGERLKSQLSKGFAENEGEAREAEAIPVTPDGPVLIQYIVQNGSPTDCEGSVFMLPEEVARGSITLAIIKAYFPIPGNFHFRCKSPTSNGACGGFVWVDLVLDDGVVPHFAGGISMKVLRLPGNDRMPRGSGVSAPSFIPAPSLSRLRSPSQVSPVGTPPLDIKMEEPMLTQEDRPSFQSSDIRLEGWESPPKADLETSSPVKAAAQPPPPPPAPPAPPADLMEWDKLDVPMASPPPPAPKQFDRDQLVAARESQVKNRVEQAQKENEQRRVEEESMKASKVQASNKLCAELDRWAKTPDGVSFKDIRSLLSTQHEVLWPDSGWKPVGLSELIQDGTIKKKYRQAIIVVHPDKMKSAEPEKQVRADRIFQALNEAFKAYTANET